MSGDGMDLESFLAEGKRSKGAFLKKWTKDGSIVVWLHTRARIHKRYQHQFHFVEAKEDKETRKIRRLVQFMRFGCWEGDEVWATRRNRETGLLESPPKLCPMCRLKEALIALPEKKLAADAVVFRMKGVNWDDEEVVLKYVKGHLTGEFERTKTSWKTTLDLGAKYLFSVLVDADPEGGVKITEESDSLGQAVRKVIAQEIDSKGDEDGNPYEHPYALKWVYDETASPKDKYKAYRYDKAKLTDEVRMQIIDLDPPDLAPYVKPGDVGLLRSYVEASITPEAKAVLDLDDIFGPAEKLAAQQEGGEDAEPRRRPAPRETDEEVRDAHRMPVDEGGGRRRKKAAPEPEPEPAGDPCDECGAPMKKGQLKCGKCGTEYESDDEPAPAKPDPKQPKAKDAVPAKKAEDDDPFGDSDDIPF